MDSEVPVHGVVVVLTSSFGSLYLGRLRTASISVLVGVGVPGSGGGSERCGVAPDIVLGFVHSSAALELLLHVPEVEPVGIDGLHDKGNESNNELDDEDGHSVVFLGVRHQSTAVSSADVYNEEDPPEPEEGSEVPGVHIGEHVESINDR